MNIIIKNILVVVALLMATGVVSAQSYTQKWNSYLERTEFYDANGNMVGYAKENTYLNRIEYYNAYGTLVKTESLTHTGT